MGGNIWKNQSLRLEKTQYFKYCEQVTNILNSFGIIDNLHVVQALRDKTDFGDMDIVLSVKPNQDLITSLRCLLDGAGYTTSTNGNVLSFLFNSFQIDLICVPQAQYDYACKYFSFNDLGNVAGLMLKQYGFKHGWQGLYYPQRSDVEESTSNGAEHVVKEHLLSLNYYKTLEIAQLDIDKFKDGFNTMEEMFQWIVQSPLFNPHIFKFENLNHTNKVRDRKRKTYNAFLIWLEKNGWFDKDIPYKKLNKKEKREYVLQYFPFIQKDIEEVDEQIRIHKICKSKFNGELVMQLTNLSGKELGSLMKILKPLTTDNIIYSMNQQEIELLIVNTYETIKHV